MQHLLQFSLPVHACRLLEVPRQLFVCLIWLILLSVPAAGFSCVLSRLFTGPMLAVNIAGAAFLALNVYFNFAAAILRHPGMSLPWPVYCGPDCTLLHSQVENDIALQSHKYPIEWNRDAIFKASV